MRLNYQAGLYGPYTPNLNKVLEALEGHYTRGYGDTQKPDVELELLGGAVEEAESFLQGHTLEHERLDRVSRLIEGFETPYGMELLSSVHWLAVRVALSPINGIKDELLGEAVEELDKDTRWAITGFAETGFDWGEAGKANLLANAQATAMNGLVAAGIVDVKANQVRLFRPEELPADWDPATDKRLTVWEMTHHPIRVYVDEKRGDTATSELLRRLGSRAEVARDLAYMLFTVCESRKRSQEAQAYNELVMGWPELSRLSHEMAKPKVPEPGELL